MIETDPKSLAVDAVLAKFQDLLLAYGQAQDDADTATQLLSEAQARREEIIDKIGECYRTAALFEFDLDKEWERRVQADQEQSLPLTMMGNEPVPSQTRRPPHSITPAMRRTTIREFVLQVAREAWPEPVRAVEIRRKLEVAGRRTHDKTVGMTLYRLSRQAMVKRHGRDWFFVPEAERVSQTDEEKPGAETPGFSQTNDLREVGHAADEEDIEGHVA